MSKEYPAGAPPPYPGPGADGAYPPPNPSYPAPYDPSKGPQAYPGGYNNPGQPGGGYAQPYGAPGYGPTSSGYQHGTTVVVAQPTLTVVQTFRESPVHTNCPHCRAEVVTGIHYETGTFTWVICLVLMFVGCGLGCCFIPFCLDGCKDVIHTCPNCQQQIARFSRM